MTASEILRILLLALALLHFDCGVSALSTECPSWYFPVNDTTTASCEEIHCECGSSLDGFVRCEENNRVRLSVLHCMTSDASTITVEGYCPYGYINSTINTAFMLQPSNVSHLTEFTCGWLNRTGVLCSHCEDSLGVAVLSYNYECIKCLGAVRGWLLYLSLALLPLTLFFFIVILCNIDATAAHMNSVICIIQIMILTLNTNSQSFLETGKAATKGAAIAVWTVMGFWNLDVFRYIYPSFCITSDMSVLHVMCLEYIVALFPLVLILVAYALIELHDSDYRVVRVPWLVVRRCLNRLKRHHTMNLDPKSSIIKYFSTFLLLAYSKILFVSFNLMAVTDIYKMDGSLLNRSRHVFYNASIPYLSSKHLPYFTLASIMMLFFNILPLLVLFLYPLKVFQKLLRSCKHIRWHPLHTFADKFQGCYKDGTNKSLDYRYFSGVFLLIRIAYHLHAVINNQYSIFITQVIPMVSAGLFGILRPYKNDFYNRLDCAHFSLLTLGQITLATNKYVVSLPISFLYIFATIPLSYFILILLYKSLALCTPTFAKKIKKAAVEKLVKKNLLFIPQSEQTVPYNEFDETSDLVSEGDSQGPLCNNPARCLLSRARVGAKWKKPKRHVTTYSTCDIDT